MGKCGTALFVVSGVLLAGLGYMLYTPLPDHLGNQWQLKTMFAKIKFSFVVSELFYQLGLSGKDRTDVIRGNINYLMTSPPSQEDQAALEIYDTELNGVPVRVYKPKSATGALPGLVYYHGGGWVVLNIPAYDAPCVHIARKANIIVISVEYRLAPEHPFPAGFDDCLQVALYALKQGRDLGLDPTRVAIGGDSAGGNLAAAVSLKLRHQKIKPALKSQLLIYGIFQMCDKSLPCMKLREKYESSAAMSVFFTRAYFNLTKTQSDLLMARKYSTPELVQRCTKLVDYKLLPKELIPDGYEPEVTLASSVTDDVKYISRLMSDTRVAPLMEEDLKNLPTSLVVAAEWDQLRDESFIFAERLKHAGNKVQLQYLSDSFHGILNAFDFEKFGFDAGPKIMSSIVDFINKELK
ncbi:arylacetamide deacetylase-like [Haliotis cracherodii]|uniref:arylacetamide deacetylase-like n=1 Tax=Haliotis cracherodii TaxID=6455 RepID=UPI0039ED133A